MKQTGNHSNVSGLNDYGIETNKQVFWNLNVSELTELALQRNESTLNDSGALVAMTGKYTGRAPKDRFIVKDAITEKTVWWGDVNIPFQPDKFDLLYKRVIDYLNNKELFVRDAFAGADTNHRLSIRIVNELAWHNLFCNNIFIRPTQHEIASHKPEFTIICAPGFTAEPTRDGTRQENFVIINFTRKIVLMGGTAYAGEMKKSIFSILNFLLPLKGVLSMHCSANMGDNRDTAIFFGLSGTGKTTLSADPQRHLIGDDEHGWTDDGVFNFEGGCYAKCIDLTKEKEPQIFDAVRFGSIVENTKYFPDTRTINFSDTSAAENTRTCYPIHYISNAVEPSVGTHPSNIFLLTCDAFGVLPPLSKLNAGQAMYHFISGYTAKVAGTEVGVTEPQTTFSACFGKAFLPLHPTKYAEMLGKKMKQHTVNVWLINTGWSGGPYGIGSRMKLSYTRALITAALNGELNNAKFTADPVFGILIPEKVSGVPAEILSPRNTWKDKNAFDQKANELASKFVKNFSQYADFATPEIMSGAPKIAEPV
ncbi:MAG: phosphoenolpyruvate carboxykinase (ATP) [Bacteroidetes bacterium RIFCSPLOWO2_12_FULL_37_12]|nr:MAG: phosphoenolpyruvate carboxykinase (ATP) [Bacteroidetes bacterium RIFCSPLOWO2_12_FULL_37_12]